MLLALLIAGTAGARNPPRTSGHIESAGDDGEFLALDEEVARLYGLYLDAPSRTTYDALRQPWAKTLRFLDLSQVPPAAQRKVSAESRTLLTEVIYRVRLPDLEEIPGASALKEGGEDGEPLTRWRIPGTEITIARVEEGPRSGEWLFSPDTVSRIKSFYELARELLYQRTVPTFNLIREYQSFTGWMIPSAWVEVLPDWANIPVHGQLLWKWFALLLLGLASGAVITVFLWGRRRPWDGSLSSFLGRFSTPLVILGLEPLLRHLFQVQINMTGSAAKTPDYLLEVATGVAKVWLIWLAASWIAEAIVASPRVSSKSLDAHLIRLIARSVCLPYSCCCSAFRPN